jgi:hypothetical protein
MKELFEKIYIKSEADLPKEGLYFCGITDSCLGSFHFNSDDKDDIDFWIGNVMWYLMPIASQFREISDEEIENAAIEGMQREEGDIIHIIDSPYASAFIDGAKWYRDQLRDHVTMHDLKVDLVKSLIPDTSKNAKQYNAKSPQE